MGSDAGAVGFGSLIRAWGSLFGVVLLGVGQLGGLSMGKYGVGGTLRVYSCDYADNGQSRVAIDH